MYKIDLDIFKQQITLNFSNIDLIKKFSIFQIGEHNFLDIKNHEEFLDRLRIFAQYNFKRTAQFIGWNHKIDKVIDIGCGIGSFDFILYKLIEQTTTRTELPRFYLVDRSEKSLGHMQPYSKTELQHGFYNSWDCSEDIINSSNISKDNFKFLDPMDLWPTDVDLVVSQYSWLWHYPSQMYLHRAYESLKPGGKLIVDILYLEEKDQIEEVSTVFKSSPVNYVEIPSSNDSMDYTTGMHPIWKKPMNELYHTINSKIGRTCCWVKS